MATSHIFHPRYRRDIDGLRAIAVLSVVLYHAFPSLLKGGYIGVDIFFVISGFLISSIIIKSLLSEKFSIIEFYIKRIKRIFPSLAIVFIFCIAFGYYTLTANEYHQLGTHIAAGAAFISNIVLWQESGYFDTSSELKPLLHLWSLGIEEQFYLIWPLILYMGFRLRANIQTVVSIIFTLSLAFCIHKTFKDPTYAFYVPTSRFWELLAGAALAYITVQRKRTLARIYLNLNRKLNPIVFDKPVHYSRNTLKHFTSLIGAALILTPLFLYSKTSLFPGFLALFPVLGAVLLILAGESAIFNNKILSKRLAVWFGLISYPLYLWHWPVIAFTNLLYTPGSPISSRNSKILDILLSIFLAWLSYRLLEKPIRKKAHSAKKAFALFIIILLLGLTGLYIRHKDGLPKRPAETLNLSATHSMVLGEDKTHAQIGCGLTPAPHFCFHDDRSTPIYAIWGDSKADALFWGLLHESEENKRWMIIGAPGTPPVNLNAPDYSSNNKDISRELDYLISNKAIKTVVITTAERALFQYPEGSTEEERHTREKALYKDILSSLNSNITRLQNSGKNVIITVDNPTLPTPPTCLKSIRKTSISWLNDVNLSGIRASCSITTQQHFQDQKIYRELIEDLASHNKLVHIYDPTPLLCDMHNGTCNTIENGHFMYAYSDHISDYSNRKIARNLLPFINQLERHAAISQGIQ